MAKSKVNKYPKGSTGRDIIDNVVIANADRNRELYDNACSIPHYFGGVEIGEDQVKLQLLKDKKNISGLSIIYDIVYSTENLQMESGDGIIYDEDDKPYIFHPTIVKFLKSCIASSFNPNQDFSYTVSSFVTTFLKSLSSTLTLPIEVSTENKTQKMILAELNDYLIKLCDITGTKYSSAVTAGKKQKKSVNELLDSVVK